MKRFLKSSLSLILAITIIFSSAYVGLSEIDFGGLFAVKAEAASSGTCGDNLTWVLDDEGALTISGTGDMTDYFYSGASWYSLRSNVKSVVINSGVTSMGGNAFNGCTSLSSITIPDSVTSVGNNAFVGCTRLKSINVNEDNTKYSSVDGVLFDKDKTTLIQYPAGKTTSTYTIPDSVASIGDYAFMDCTSLTSITIPNSVTSIGISAFRWCTNLSSIIIGDIVTSIGPYAFMDCTSLTSVTILDSVTSVGAYAFGYLYNFNTEQEEKIDGFTIHGKLGTAAEVYANENGFAFINISEVCNHELSDWIIDREAISSEDGLKHKECTKCGETVETAVIPYVGDDFSTVFHNDVSDLWWYVSFDENAQIYDFSPETIKFFVTQKINLENYFIGEKDVVNEYGTFNGRGYSIPAEVFEGEALKHFNISDISVLRNDISEPVYNSETNSYDMVKISDRASTKLYSTKGYINLGNGIYEVYGYTSTSGYKVTNNSVEGVDYIMYAGRPFELLRGVKVTLEYNSTDVKFLSWETIPTEEVESAQNLTHSHNVTDWVIDVHPGCSWSGTKHKYCISCGKVFEIETIPVIEHAADDWIIDKPATVNNPGEKHKECKMCGEVLKIASIPQLKPATPTLSKIQNTASGAKVTWGKVSGADEYKVYRKTYNAKTKAWSGWSRIAVGVTSTSYVDKTAKSGTYYRYTVIASNESGNSSYDTTGLKTYFLSTPTVSATNSNSGVTVKWSKSTGATGYYVYRKTGNGNWQKIATVKGAGTLSYTDKKASAGVTYRYTVKAYYSSYVSAYHTNGFAVRRLTTPTLKSVTSAKAGVTFKWNKVTGATGYTVYRKTGSGGWQKLATVNNTKSSYLDKSAKKGVTYTYTVRAYYGTSTSYYNTKGLTIKDKY